MEEPLYIYEALINAVFTLGHLDQRLMERFLKDLTMLIIVRVAIIVLDVIGTGLMYSCSTSFLNEYFLYCRK